MRTNSAQRTEKLVAGGIMIALAIALSFIKIFHMPYGGSVTLCSMLPITIIAFRYGTKWGLCTAFTYSVLSLLLDSASLKGITGGALIGSIFFDYIIAATVLGLAGILRNKIGNKAIAFSLGTLFAIFLRFISHVISGVIFFAEYAEWYFSQEGFEFGHWILENVSGAMLFFVYSVIYNAMYMVPEMIITTVAAFVVARIAGTQIFPDNDQIVKS